MKDENTGNKTNCQRAITGYCEKCQAELHGELGVKSETINGIPVITIAETAPRNWILCDSCNALLCRDCCLQPHTGLCNACFNRAEKDNGLSGIRMLLLGSSASQTGGNNAKGDD